MANNGFGLTATQVNKVLGKGEWTEQIRVKCYMIAAIAELPDNVALAEFVSLCNILGIQQANHTKISNDVWVDTFSASGKVANSLTEIDMRKAIAAKVFGDEKKFKMLAAITGDDLLSMYDMNCGKSKDDLPFVIHRMRIGKFVIFKVTQDGQSVHNFVKEAIRVLINRNDAKEEDYKEIL